MQQRSTSELEMEQYLFLEFRANEFQQLTSILSTVFVTSSEELGPLYDCWRSEFNHCGYPEHTVNRDFSSPMTAHSSASCMKPLL